MKKIFFITYLVAICLFAAFWLGCQKEHDPYVVLSVGKEELMVQSKDLGAGDWETAKTMCVNSTVAGFTDWRLPSEPELMILYNNRKSIGGFLKRPYWSGTYYQGEVSYVNFKNGKLFRETPGYGLPEMGMVRAVRTIPQ